MVDKEKPGVNLEPVRIEFHRLDPTEAADQIHQNYLFDPILAYKIKKRILSQLDGGDAGDQFELAAIERSPLADAVTVSRDGVAVSGSEVAQVNLEAMARATEAKWFVALERMMGGSEIVDFPVHRADGRVQIAIPGVHYGMEIGGILDWFNAQGVVADITAVDSRRGGGDFGANYDERLGVSGSSVTRIEADASQYFLGKETDMVVFRHPGPIANVEQQGRWREIFKSMVETKPGLVVLSTYNYPIVDPLAAGRIDGEVFDSEIFEKWLVEMGYEAVGEEIENDDLKYPVNIYGLQETKGDRKISVRAVDRYMRLLRRK